MEQQSATFVKGVRPRSSRLYAIEAWMSLAIGLPCSIIYAFHPTPHPKGGDGDVKAIIYFVTVAALVVALSIVGMRRCCGVSRLAAFVGFGASAFVLIDLFKVLCAV